ncbi:MAG: Zn-ribbon domain-containing OB-fold protein [Promethearchaeota archaeon]
MKEKLEWKKCDKCGLLQYKSHLRCLKCKNPTFTFIEARGTAKLLNYTILKAPPAEFRYLKSYTLGVVEFKNGVKALGQITSQEHLSTGMELNPVYKKICENLDGNEVYGYVFEPV